MFRLLYCSVIYLILFQFWVLLNQTTRYLLNYIQFPPPNTFTQRKWDFVTTIHKTYSSFQRKMMEFVPCGEVENMLHSCLLTDKCYFKLYLYVYLNFFFNPVNQPSRHHKTNVFSVQYIKYCFYVNFPIGCVNFK